MNPFKKAIAIFFVILVAAIGPIYSACTAGGEGSSSCTYSTTDTYFFGMIPITNSHSVSCGDGYYACCGEDGAECYENGTPEPEDEIEVNI